MACFLCSHSTVVGREIVVGATLKPLIIEVKSLAELVEIEFLAEMGIDLLVSRQQLLPFRPQ